MNRATLIKWVAGWSVYAVTCATGQAEEPMLQQNPEVVRVAINPFDWRGDGKPPIDLARIVAEDLRRDGSIFPIVARTPVIDPKTGEISLGFDKWRQQGVHFLVTGQFYRVAGDEAGLEKYASRFQLYEVKGEDKREERTLEGDASAVRRLAHGISDDIYLALTGERGVFNTRIAYIAKGLSKNGRTHFSIKIADADGENSRSVVVSDAPLRAPAWSPDGEYISYIAMEKGRPQLFRQRLTTGTRERLSEALKMNSAPEWSPDGGQLLFSTADNARSCIYLLDVETKGLRCVINRSVPIADPSWAPDGLSVIYTAMDDTLPELRRQYFTSNEDKPLDRPSIYGHYAVFAPDGLSVAYVQRTHSRREQLAIKKLDTGSQRILHTATHIGKPSFASNGRQLIVNVSNRAAGHARSVLFITSVDGRASARITNHNADFADPAWSPLPRQ